MSHEIRLGRRLLEAATGNAIGRGDVEDASRELAFVRGRRRSGYVVETGGFDDVDARDLSAEAWLLLLESRSDEAALPPDRLLLDLYLSVDDDVHRLRLVLATVGDGSGYPGSAAESSDRVGNPRPSWLESLLRIMANDARSTEAISETAAENLERLVLYLLQNGSAAALAWAWAAVMPRERWRARARRRLQRWADRWRRNMDGREF